MKVDAWQTLTGVTRTCPACGCDLTPWAVGEVPLTGCHACGSVWFERGGIEAAGELEGEALGAVEREFGTGLGGGQGDGRCPVDGTPLVRLRWHQAPAVELRGCPTCRGILCADGDLARIEAALPADRPRRPGRAVDDELAAFRLETVACPHCGERCVAEQEHCDRCGGGLDGSPPEPLPRRLRCPWCDAWNPAELDRCQHCHGLLRAAGRPVFRAGRLSLWRLASELISVAAVALLGWIGFCDFNEPARWLFGPDLRAAIAILVPGWYVARRLWRPYRVIVDNDGIEFRAPLRRRQVAWRQIEEGAVIDLPPLPPVWAIALPMCYAGADPVAAIEFAIFAGLATAALQEFGRFEIIPFRNVRRGLLLLRCNPDYAWLGPDIAGHAELIDTIQNQLDRAR